MTIISNLHLVTEKKDKEVLELTSKTLEISDIYNAQSRVDNGTLDNMLARFFLCDSQISRQANMAEHMPRTGLSEEKRRLLFERMKRNADGTQDGNQQKKRKPTPEEQQMIDDLASSLVDGLQK